MILLFTLGCKTTEKIIHNDERDDNEYNIDDNNYKTDIEIKDSEDIDEIKENIDNSNYKIKCEEGSQMV